MTWLSVLTPTRNYARFISDAILSVEKQGSGGVEHVVVDAASEDGTSQILEMYPKLITLSEPDKGQSDALNKALHLSSGEWIGWLNADEFHLPATLELVRKTIDSDPGIDVVFGDSVFVREDGQFMRLLAHHPFSARILRSYGCYINSCSTFFRRHLLEEKSWDQRLNRIMDWDLWLHFAAAGARFHYLNRPLGAFRVHEARVSAAHVPYSSDQHMRVRRRHGMTLSAPLIRVGMATGRIHRASLKVLAGSYVREYRAIQEMKDKNLRWFAPEGEAAPAIRRALQE